MSTKVKQRHWFQVDCNYFQNTKIQLAGPLGALVGLYVLSYASSESYFTDGALPLKKWCAKRIKIWLGVTGSSFTVEQIQEGMDGLVESEVIIIDESDEICRFAGYEEWFEEKRKEISQRSSQKYRDKMKQRDQETSRDSHATVTPRHAASRVTNSDPREEKRREEKSRDNIYTSSFEHESTSKSNVVYDNNTNNEVDIDNERYRQAVDQLTGDYVGLIIANNWQDYPIHLCKESSVKLRNSFSTLLDCAQTIDDAVNGWTPDRTIHCKGGLHSYLYSFFSIRADKERNRRA